MPQRWTSLKPLGGIKSVYAGGVELLPWPFLGKYRGVVRHTSNMTTGAAAQVMATSYSWDIDESK